MSETSVQNIERVCGIPVHSLPHEDVLVEMDNNILGKRKRLYISITNTESMYFARRIAEHSNYIENATFSLCDGVGIVIGARLRRQRIRRYYGPDLLRDCCEYGVKRKWRHFFCGGKEGIADMLSEKLTNRFSGMITAGVFCPPFRELTPEEETKMIQLINDAKPDILWVGLGLLKQERWIAKYIDRIDVPWMVGVGAAFDLHSGTVRKAPAWVQRIGMVWLPRLIHEPRMFRRCVRSCMFLSEAIVEAILCKERSIIGSDYKLMINQPKSTQQVKEKL